MYGYGWNAGGWVVMGVMMLLFCAAVILLIVFLVRAPRGEHHTPPSTFDDDPERILRQRFARGEIDESDYVARLEVLRRR